jgi:hypothetical protein
MNEFARCLEELDVAAATALWPVVFPGQPVPNSDGITIFLHYARTESQAMPLRLRVYSHRWLTERGMPSGLPDELRQKADRLYPRIVEAVGVGVKAFSEATVPLARAIERAMSDAVADCYANGDRDPAIVKARMDEARARTMRG